jgi:NitT/TauT family transport system permease protein
MQRLLNPKPRAGAGLFIGLLPILAVALIYLGASAAGHIDNPRLPPGRPGPGPGQAPP